MAFEYGIQQPFPIEFRNAAGQLALPTNPVATLSKNAAAANACANAVTLVGTGGGDIILTAAEMQCARGQIFITSDLPTVVVSFITEAAWTAAKAAFVDVAVSSRLALTTVGATAGGVATIADILAAVYAMARGKIVKTGNAYAIMDDDDTTTLFTVTIAAGARTTS